MSDPPTILEALTEFANPQNWAIRRPDDRLRGAVRVRVGRPDSSPVRRGARRRERA